MNVKNTTPFLFGRKVTSRRPPRPEMVLVVRGAFSLRPNEPLAPLPDQGALTAETFRPDDDERRGDCLYPGDFADFKANAEVMLRGACQPPGRGPFLESPVRFAVGGWSKTLRVVGMRAWSDRLPGAVPSEPRAFKTVRLDWTESFGGPGHPTNPVGKGFETDLLPSIERPGEPLTTRRDRPEPAGFGPINPAWPQRAGKLGKEYGRAWREKRAPFYAEDLDWTYFHAASADQQLEGYLRGDEEVAFQNLHPAAATFSVRLPALRIRAFVKDVRGKFREARMRLDTLFADLDAGTLFLTWRGLDAVEQDDLSDVSAVRIASEPLASEPIPAERYRAELDAFEADPIGLREILPPPLAELAERNAAEARGEVSPDEPVAGSKARMARLMDAAVARLPEKAKGEVGARLKAPPPGGGEAPPLIPLKPGSAPVVKVGPKVRTLLAEVERTKREAAARGQPVMGLEAVDAFLNDPRLRQLDPTFDPARAVDPAAEPGPGRDLVGVDLTGRDLHGADLSGANLEGAILTRADLRGANLAGARLAYAVLYEADLAGADLTGADLTKALVAKASASGARLDRATIEQASFEGTDLGGASFVEAKGEYVRFSKADLRKARAAGGSFTRSHFDGAKLAEADLEGATLTACLFRDAEARGAVLARATIVRASFEAADLRGANLSGVRGEAAAFVRARLDDADLRYAWLVGAHFTEASANRAGFVEANLKESRFHRASMESASFEHANLLSADLTKARMTEARFTGANLYDAKLLGAAGKGCDFSGANLKRSTLETPP